MVDPVRVANVDGKDQKGDQEQNIVRSEPDNGTARTLATRRKRLRSVAETATFHGAHWMIFDDDKSGSL
jgi:hypothetical protein